MTFSVLARRIAAACAAFLSFSAFAEGPPFVPGQVLVQGSAPEFSEFRTLKQLPLTGLTILEVQRGSERSIVRYLRGQGRWATVNLIAKKSSDPYRSFQWHFDNVQAEQAWAINTGIKTLADNSEVPVVVAVLDTGLATPVAINDHQPDGVNQCLGSGINMLNSNSPPLDGDGHGTHVSGTIAQRTNNGVGGAGLAFNACILPVKVLGDDGSGDFAHIAEGIHEAVDAGADVINMSLGTNARYGVTSITAMDSALDYAEAQGVVVVAASGNDGHRKNVSYPAIYPSVIAVGATDFRDRVVRYSNRGTGLDMVAPGGDLGRNDNNDEFADGVLQETFDSSGEWNFYFLQGTSMASPHVAAAAALLIGSGIDDPAAVRAILFSSAKDIGDSGFDSVSGHGLLQAAAALGAGDSGGSGGCIDNDGDGYCIDTDPVDCDDDNPDVHPGHNDTRGRWGRDTDDNDCNGLVNG